MAKRILDGEAMWSSKKIASLPEAYRAEYSWLHSLAAANGVFERDDRVIWAKCYAITRPNKSPDDVTAILNDFIAVKLLFPWSAEGKEWLYWTNSDRPGRLPRKSWQERERKNGRLPPDPPQDTLQTFLHESAHQGRAANTAGPCKSVPGSGLGSGLGTGSGIPSSEAGASDKAKKPITQSGQETNLEAVRPLATLLAQRILENNPKTELRDEKLRERRIKAWTIDLEKMVRLDEWTVDEIRQLIEFSQSDQFWRTNILSAGKLREKRDQLKLKMEQQGGQRGTPSTTGNNSRAGKRPGPFIPAALKKSIPAPPNALTRVKHV